MSKNILYFLSPTVGNIENQKFTIDLHFNKISQLNNSDLNIYFCGHQIFSSYILEKKYNLQYFGIPFDEKTSDDELVSSLRNVISIKPDIVIVYEGQLKHAKEAFPNAIVVSESWGALSRFPFPGLIQFDDEGVYNFSSMYNKRKELLNSKLSNEEKKHLLDIRNHSLLSLSKNIPTILYDCVKKLTNKKRILLPLQIDNHISFTNCTSFKNHKEMIEAFFNQVDENIDVIITQHPDADKKVLSDIDVAYFNEKYSNFHYFSETEHIPFVSQWWLIFIDAVATVSSGVAFQAAFMGLPVIAIGKSHINAVASTNLKEMNQFILNEEVSKADASIWKIMKEQVFYDEYLFDPIQYESIINKLINQRTLTQEGDIFVEKFKKYYRENLLQDLLKEKGISTISYDILNKVIECQALSFDLFDTLVERPFFDPHDLFFLAENKIRQVTGNNSLRFFSFRRKAEEEARKARNWNETTFSQIYYQFKKLTGCSDNDITIMKNIELDMEEQVLTRKYKIHRIFEWGKKLGKKVSIITDIYHDKETIERFLKRVNINGYDKLYVSADLDLRKHDGTLYPIYLKDIQMEYGITCQDNFKNMLHIGDNPTADIKMAQEYGLRTHHIHKSSDQLKSSLLGKVFESNIRKRWVTDSILMGLISNRFNEDLELNYKQSLFGGNLYSFGYIAGGVMMLGFVQHVIEQTRKNNFEKVCFVARDGYIFKEIYDMLRKTPAYKDLPPSDYLVLSRRATALASCRSTEDIKKLVHLNFGNQPLSDLLLNRFGISIDLIPVNILDKHYFSKKDIIQNNLDLGRLCGLIDDISNIILNQCEKERLGLLKYFNNKDINQNSHICLVDIGYSGSIQQNVNKLFNANFAGYYMLTHEAPRHLMRNTIFDGWFESFDEQRSANYHLINDYIFFFETLLSSEDLSVSNYTLDNDGNLVTEFQSAEDENSRIKFIRETHNGIIDFTQDYCNQFAQFSDTVQFSKKLALHTVMSLAQNPSYEDAKLFLQLNVENKFGGGDASLIYTQPNMLTNPTDKVKNLVINKSQWKEGARALFLSKNKLIGTNNQPSINLNVINTNSEQLPLVVRKYLKYKKNPYRFFADSKNIAIRPLKLFYKNYR
jgi:predicted HAD superfamily hydrolase